jgi:hypothetical protein
VESGAQPAAEATQPTAAPTPPVAQAIPPTPAQSPIVASLPSELPAVAPQTPKLASAEHLRPVIRDMQRPWTRPGRATIPAARIIVPVPSTTSIASTPATTTTATKSARTAGRWYTLADGDSLWTIAARLLGLPQDSTKENNARIQAEVDRLWNLNAARIGTGDPSKINAGTRIRLR